MSSGQAAKTSKGDDGFTVRTVMAMATEMAEARASMNRACIAFVTVAASVGVAIDWDKITG